MKTPIGCNDLHDTHQCRLELGHEGHHRCCCWEEWSDHAEA